MPPSTPMPAAIDTESSRQSAELAAFRRMLIVSEGTFSLSFSVYNVRHLRDELIEQLTAEFDGIAVVHLPPGTPDVLEVVQQQIESKTPRAVFVLDIEQSLPHDAKSYPILRSLNASRELWERWSCPVVLWVAEHAAGLLAARAVDFWRYRSHSFEFTARPLDAGDWQAEQFAGFDMVHGLPLEEKRFRRAELQQRLEQAGVPPPLQMLPHVLGWMYELAVLHEMFRDYEASESIRRQALQLSEQEYGPDSPRAAIALNNLAHLLKATNRLAEVEPLMRRAVDIEEQRVAGVEQSEPPEGDDAGGSVPSTPATPSYLATYLNNLAQLLQATNRLTEAETLMRRVLGIYEQFFGENHPHVATAINNLARLLQDTNRLAEAEPLMRRALEIDQQSYGDQHPKVARDLNNLAMLLRDMAKSSPAAGSSRAAADLLAEAESLIRRCLVITQQFREDTGREHAMANRRAETYLGILEDMGLAEEEIERRFGEIGRGDWG